MAARVVNLNLNTAPVLPVLHSPLLQGIAGVSHGFFTRLGGVSTTPCDSLNCSFGSSDAPDAITENRRRVAVTMAAQRLFTVTQVHGREAVNVDREAPAVTREGDALVTATPGVFVGVTTADCVPVLLADPDAGVVAAAHAGWRGALAGVVVGALEAMTDAGATRSNIRAAIGPCIQQSSYEVGAEVFESLCEGAPFDARFLFEPRGERFLFDLPGFVRALCLDGGIALLDNLGADTYDEPGQFFSYRRTCHQGGGDYGRQISVIGLTG